MKSALTLLIVLFILPFSSQAQINDCSAAVVVCSNANLDFNPMGPGHNDFADPDNDEGCITVLEQNSAWFYFQINPGAPMGLVLGFIIHPEGGLGEDYDWALFGPDVNCSDLGSPIRCSSSSAACGFCPETGMGMGATDFSEGPGSGDGFVSTLVVEPGQGFYLMIDNWLGTTAGFILEWTDSAAPFLNCGASPPCAIEAEAGPDIAACEGDEGVQLFGSSIGNHGNETYVWTGTNGGDVFLDNPDVPTPVVNLPPGFSGTITYTLTVAEDTCLSVDQMDLIVHPLPSATISAVGSLCPSDPIHTLTGLPAGGIWGGDATGNTFNPLTNGPGIHTVTYSYTDSYGCTTITPMDIFVYNGPDVSIDPDPAEFCESENSIPLTAVGVGGTGEYEYLWTIPTGMAVGNMYNASLPGTYTVTITDENGCTNSSAISVVMHLNPEIEINDPGPICASTQFFTLTATPSFGLFEGDIISGSGDIMPNMIGPGIYEISYFFTDNHNCESTAYFNITIIPIPEAIAGNNGPYCQGQPFILTGSTDATSGSISYLWTGPGGFTSNVQNPTNATTAGEYILEVIVDECSSELSSTIVVVHDQPEAIAVNGGPYCNGETIQLSGSTNESGNVIAYAWSGPNGYSSDVQNPSNATEAGIYSLIVSIDGCLSQATSTNVVFSTPPNAMAANSGPYCQGEAVTLFGNSTTSGTLITYQWTGPNGYISSVQNPIDVVESGVYQLVVDVDGCKSLMASTAVTIHPLPQPLITGQAAFCTGFSSTMDAGAGYMNYVWDNGNTNQTREVFASGTYYVTITDVNGCIGTASFIVTENASLSPVITGTIAFCEGASTILDAGPGFDVYAWSTGESSQTIEVSDEGNIGVIVTDADGCTGSAIVTTIVHTNPNVTIGGSTTYCIGGYTVLDAGVFSSYEWSNDSTSQTITVTTPGVYAVNVVDSNGCTGSASANISESTSLNPVITGSHTFCENGSTTLDAGSGFATYLWSDGSINQTLVVSIEGNYAVTVSDGQSCFGDTVVSVTEVFPPGAQLQTATTLCNTVAGGSMIDLYDLILSGDVNGNWQDVDNSGAGGLFDNLNFASVPAGDYRFLYTTNSAIDPCPEETYEVVVTVIDCTCPDVFFFNTSDLCNAGDVLDLTTIENTSETGTWSIVQTPGGVNPATLNGNVFDATTSDPGAYVFQFSLQNQPPPGCPSDFEVLVNIDPSVDAGIAAQPIAFCVGNDQLIDLNALITGADANGTWKETSSLPSQGIAFDPTSGIFKTNNQVPGTYRFKYVLESNGVCPDDETEVSVEINALPTVIIVDNVALNCDNPIQSLDASGSSFGAEYDIIWTGPGLLDANDHTLQPSIDQAGNYVLTIENTLTGCSNTASVTVIANTDPPTNAIISSHDPACFGEQNAFIHIDQVIGGEPPYAFSLNNGVSSASAYYDNLSAGEYTLVVTDDNGCLWDTTIVLVEQATVQIELGPDIELDLGESTTVHAVVNLPADQIEQLSWTPEALIECVDVNCLEVNLYPFYSFTLNATVSDLNGCKSTDALNIVVDADRNVYIPNVFSPNGDGTNDLFFITGNANQIKRVTQFTIFNRWGGVVYEAQDFSLNDPANGWDGHDRDKLVNPGVFTYVVEVEFIDGIVLRYLRDVTVVR